MSLRERDKKVVWHPFTQMKTEGDALPIVRGEGVYLYDEDGKEYIDVNSSWWVNVHGHCHPDVVQAIAQQADKLEHVVFAGMTHEPGIEVAERVLGILPDNAKRIFFSDNGSTAVEVALKCAVQYWFNKGEPRNKIIAMEGAYHGDTFGAMSVSARDQFNRPFHPLLFDVEYIPVPTRDNFADVKQQFSRLAASGEFAAFIVEPLVQGAVGMVMYTPEQLEELASIAKANAIFFIADEVMTGFGRTGKMFATDYIDTKPDMVCLSKGLTAGFLAMGLTSFTDEVYNMFLDDDKMRGFLHGHSFTANPMTCAAALAGLDLFEQPEAWEGIRMIEAMHREFVDTMKGQPLVRDVRCFGTIAAIEIETDAASGYFSDIRTRAYAYFLENGLISRPLGNIIYINPPYCISKEDLEKVYRVYREFIASIE